MWASFRNKIIQRQLFKRTPHSIALFVFLIMTLISQILIPTLNSGKDFLFFTKWNLYSLNPQDYVYDVYCKKNNTQSFYIFRDKPKFALSAGLKFNAIHHQISNFESQKISNDSQQKIYQICKDATIELHKIPLTYFKHFVKKDFADAEIVAQL